jgi:hypothetical protein
VALATVHSNCEFPGAGFPFVRVRGIGIAIAVAISLRFIAVAGSSLTSCPSYFSPTLLSKMTFNTVSYSFNGSVGNVILSEDPFWTNAAFAPLAR